ncbi:MAG TPA: phosphoribosylaminoimidazolesuccinocarboxamide synthase [Gemmatimonadaceae bacterium]|nr:phosphoribosylaminoimidazolesuccinocarboxamide synthase [Gemmatimonadaceae bacterium]
MIHEPLLRSELPLRLLRQGKVRDVYDAGPDKLLLIATDRVSAFDVVMAEGVPHKGAVLTQLTAWWLRRLGGEVEHHMLSANSDEIVDALPALASHRELLAGRAMLSRKADVFPIECVIRGYLAGSAWKEYGSHGTLAGEPLAPGLRESSPLDPPLFSPATKAETGHDENITVGHAAAIVGADRAGELERLTRLVYDRGRAYAGSRGIIIADTKLEFGEVHGRVILVDEVLTPDSSRFWPADRYEEGVAPPSFDKQPLRDHLEREKKSGRWNGDPPPPPLPTDVIDSMSRRYLDIYERLTGEPLPGLAA